jgi:hypothetical protein
VLKVMARARRASGVLLGDALGLNMCEFLGKSRVRAFLHFVTTSQRLLLNACQISLVPCRN